MKQLIFFILLSGSINAQSVSMIPPDTVQVFNGFTNVTLKLKFPAEGYVTPTQITTLLAAYEKYTDTASMLTKYLRKGDTAAMLAPYLKAASITGKLNTSDTAAMLTAYIRKGDTAAMLSNYVRKSFLNAGAGLSYNAATGTFANTSPDQVVSITAGNGLTVTGTYPAFTVAMKQPTLTYPTRTANSNFTISTTLPATVMYTVTCSVTNPLLVGTSAANAYLEYSTNAGSSWQLVTQSGNSSGVGITVTLQLTNGQTGVIGGDIPANALIRIRTTTFGTASVTIVNASEKVL